MKTFTKLTNEQAATLITAIVTAIPGATLTRDADQRPHGFKLAEAEGVWLSYDSYKHRLNVSGQWPYSRLPGEANTRFGPWELHPRPEDTSISISADKNVPKIATEIPRRFIPAYRTVLALCLARRDSHESYETNKKQLAQTVATALGARLRNNDGTCFDLPANLTATQAYGDVTVSGEASVEFKVRHLDTDRALKRIAFLKTL